LDAIDVWLLHPLEELPRVRRERFHVTALPFGVARVEVQRRLSRSAHTGDDRQLACGQRAADILQVVPASAASDQRVARCLRLFPPGCDDAVWCRHGSEFPSDRKEFMLLHSWFVDGARGSSVVRALVFVHTEDRSVITSPRIATRPPTSKSGICPSG